MADKTASRVIPFILDVSFVLLFCATRSCNSRPRGSIATNPSSLTTSHFSLRPRSSKGRGAVLFGCRVRYQHTGMHKPECWTLVMGCSHLAMPRGSTPLRPSASLRHAGIGQATFAPFCRTSLRRKARWRPRAVPSISLRSCSSYARACHCRACLSDHSLFFPFFARAKTPPRPLRPFHADMGTCRCLCWSADPPPRRPSCPLTPLASTSSLRFVPFPSPPPSRQPSWMHCCPWPRHLAG